jgi:hypothetical protein
LGPINRATSRRCMCQNSLNLRFHVEFQKSRFVKRVRPRSVSVRQSVWFHAEARRRKVIAAHSMT